MNDMICLVGKDSNGSLLALAQAWRAQHQHVFVCALPESTGATYDLVLEGDTQAAVLERMAAKARIVVRLGLHPLTLRLDAGCGGPQVLVLQPGEGRSVAEEWAAQNTQKLALLRLLERRALAVLAPVTEQSLCLRPVHVLRNSHAQTIADAVLGALDTPTVAEQALSKFFTRPGVIPLSPALRALSTEVLALRADAEKQYKSLRDAGHVTASTLLPEALPLPGGRQLAHFMRFTALCPPDLWAQASPDAQDVLRMAVARWVLEGLAEALETLIAHAHMHESVAYAALLCASGTDMADMDALNAHIGTSPAAQAVLPTFVQAFARCSAAFSPAHAAQLQHSVTTLPRLGDQLVWGCAPILNNKYWSLAMRQGGADSCTLMPAFYDSINAVADYDLYFHDVTPPWACCLQEAAAMSAFLYVAYSASVMHMPFRGGPLSGSTLSRLEPDLLHAAGVKSVMIPYGSDAYMYSRLASPTLTHVLNVSYPSYARDEETVRHNVFRWSARADFVLGWAMTVGNGFPRWDALVVAPFHIDTQGWAYKTAYSDADGRQGRVRILHCPNHRTFKGTVYIMAAMDSLKAEGLEVELVLLERVQNTVVRQTMLEVDILVDQCLAHYALNALEGMVSGLPVCSNLEEPDLTVLRRFSYLNECPIVSVTPETLADRLRPLVQNPDLRRRLGQAGRAYVEKYHSLPAARHLYGTIHTKLLHDDSTDTQSLYHPLLSEYVRNNPVPCVLDKGRVRPEDVPPKGVTHETY